jgi:predicted lysophospholipase L1 biosynthesis ABC-type transport system permease subunit
VLAAAQRKQLPIFPLNVVALPHAVVPLMIFEARYAYAWLQMPSAAGVWELITHFGGTAHSVVALHAVASRITDAAAWLVLFHHVCCMALCTRSHSSGTVVLWHTSLQQLIAAA